MFLIVSVLVGLVLGIALSIQGNRFFPVRLLASLLAGLVAGSVLSCLRVIPAGHVGIVDLFGQVADQPLASGLRLVNPLVAIVPISIRTQEDKETMEVPSKEGLNVQLEVSVLYRLDPERAVEVYRTVGPEYQDVILVPQFRSIARGVTAEEEAKALYTSQREVLAQRFGDHLKELVGPRGIIVEKVLLRKVALPTTVRDAVEQKLKAEQDAERMKFILQRENQEAERKRIEAQGIRDAQGIINESLTSQYLHYLWINTLNQNPNVIYVATEANMPLFRVIHDTVGSPPRSLTAAPDRRSGGQRAGD